MRANAQVLAALTLIASLSGAVAQERCPELSRLQSEAAEAAKKATRLRPDCEAYIRYSEAWAEIVRFANAHSEQCDVSPAQVEKRYRQVVEEREYICVGRRRSAFPAEIRPRW